MWNKDKILWISILVLARLTGYGQDSVQPVRSEILARLSHDNDLFNYRGVGTDEAYTAGLRADIFFTKKHNSTFFLDRILPAAGKSAVNVFQYGVMQVIYTPIEITDSAYQPNDYAFAGGLYASHSLYSYNALKKYDFQTEIDLGIMGPPALAEQSQELVHRLIHYLMPEGWKNQLKTDILFNVHFTAEKQFGHTGHFVEVIGGAKISAGTMLNAATVYPMIRIGWMHPYFEGFIKQYSTPGEPGPKQKKKMQFYMFVRPSVQWVLTNAMIEGGLFSGHSKLEDDKLIYYPDYKTINHVVYAVDFGLVLNRGHWSASVAQNITSLQIKNTYHHEYGNVSLYFTW